MSNLKPIDKKLFDAIKNRSFKVIREIIHAGADVNAKRGKNITPVVATFKHDRVDVLKYLLKFGATFTFEDLQKACYYRCSTKCAKLLIEQRKFDVNQLGKFDCSLMHLSAKCGATEVMQCLLDNGADINKKNKYGKTPLIVASPSVMQWLIEHGADVNIQDQDGKTALHTCAYLSRNNLTKITELLLEHGADVNLLDKDGNTVLHYCRYISWGEAPKTTELLLKHGIDVNAQNNEGMTALHLCADIFLSDSAKVAELLLKHGADIEAKNYQGKTPLLQAAAARNKDLLKILIAYGADVNAVDKECNTALTRVIWAREKEMVQLLFDAGADVDIVDSTGKTAMDYAEFHGYQHILQRDKNLPQKFSPLYINRLQETILKMTTDEVLAIPRKNPKLLEKITIVGSLASVFDQLPYNQQKQLYKETYRTMTLTDKTKVEAVIRKTRIREK